MARSTQLGLPIPSTWGGARQGARRPVTPGRRRATPHRARPEHKTRFPVQVTMRTRAEVPPIRLPPVFVAIRQAIAKRSSDAFPVVPYSVQSDPLHLIVDALDGDQPTSRVQSRKLSVACEVN